MFFDHVRARGHREPLSSTTRYLCAAAYLDRVFQQKVIAEFIAEKHRAVAPVRGYDLEAVILHCLHARRLALFRDLAMILITVAALVLNWQVTLAVLLILGALAVFDGTTRSTLVPDRFRGLVLVGVGGLILYVASTVLEPFLSIFEGGGRQDIYDAETGTYVPQDSSGGAGDFFFAAVMVIVIYAAIYFLYMWAVYRVLSKQLTPFSTQQPPATSNSLFRARLDRLSRAQRGNITLYGAENPFIGEGDLKKVWSIVLELDRLTDEGDGGPATRPDPAEIYDRVIRRLEQMKLPDPHDPSSLRKEESIMGLDRPERRVYARGLLPQYLRPSGQGEPVEGHPLVDSETSVPFSWASPEAMNEIVRHPQGSLRCYLRVAVRSPGQTVSSRGRLIVPAEDQDVAMVAFLHLAVEGRMLYAQFAATALKPVRPEFKVVDDLWQTRSGPLVSAAVQLVLRAAPYAMVFALPNAVRTGRRMFIEIGSPHVDPPAELTRYNYGARFSAREMAAASSFETYLQVLDTDKYIRLIERRVNEAILDYLQECRVDVSAYREQMGAIIDNSVTITGGSVSGQVNTGARSTMNQFPRL